MNNIYYNDIKEMYDEVYKKGFTKIKDLRIDFEKIYGKTKGRFILSLLIVYLVILVLLLGFSIVGVLILKDWPIKVSGVLLFILILIMIVLIFFLVMNKKNYNFKYQNESKLLKFGNKLKEKNYTKESIEWMIKCIDDYYDKKEKNRTRIASLVYTFMLSTAIAFVISAITGTINNVKMGDLLTVCLIVFLFSILVLMLILMAYKFGISFLESFVDKEIKIKHVLQEVVLLEYKIVYSGVENLVLDLK